MIDIIDSKNVLIIEMLAKREVELPDITPVVAEILAEVKAKGDVALKDYTARFDGAQPSQLRVLPQEIEAARASVGPEMLTILEAAAGNIRAFHQKQVRQGFVMAEQPGVVMGQKITPLACVGVYVPGGTAAYPSTVLMDVIPARIAGVERVVMVTPPDKNGDISPVILAAASVAGVDEIYKVGGAQAVAALAYGTQSIPRVDKIVGPGNQYVAVAKRMVFGLVDIDMIAGPSDILVLADDSATPEYVAADMLGQAEHDVLASSVLVTTSRQLAQEVKQEIERQLPLLSRKEIAAQSLQNRGSIIIAQNDAEAMQIANQIAPEHLELCVKDPFALLPEVKNAGSIFLGHNTPEALGDYYAGPNHTLPTEGTARFSSPLSVDDFIKKSSYLYYSQDALQKVGKDVAAFADSEGLQAHANSIRVRLPK